jgi:hypothetical protein
VVLEGRSVFGDIVRYGRPFQAQVDLSVNSMGLSQDCKLEIAGEEGGMTSQLPLRLGPGKRTLSLPVVSTRYAPEVRLQGLPGSIAVGSSMSPAVASEQDYLALTLSPRKNQFAYLGGYKSLLKSGEFRLNHPTPGGDLPDLWWTYLGHDAVILHDVPNLKLSDEVERALLDWTQAGGNLVLVSNLDPAELADTAWEKLAPLQATGVEEKQGVAMLVGRAAPSQVLLKRHGLPLLLRRNYGAGSIWQITAALDSQDVLGTQLTTKIWAHLVRDDQPGLNLRKEFVFGGRGRLAVLPELPAPATAALAWYLAFYVLLVIPGVYTYLRRKDQVLRLIVVVPACSTLITMGAYYFNSTGRGRELVLRELGLAWVRGGQRQVVLDQTGVVFSPAPLKLALSLANDTLLIPNSQMGRDASPHLLNCQGERLQLEPERLRQWGISRWLGFGVRQLPQPISLKLQLQGTRWKVEVDNRSGLRLSRAVLVVDSSNCSQVVEIKPGPQVFVLGDKVQPLQSVLTGAQLDALALSSEDADNLQREIQVVRGTRPVLVGCVDDPLFSVLHPVGVQPKTLRRTYLVVSEDEP